MPEEYEAVYHTVGMLSSDSFDTLWIKTPSGDEIPAESLVDIVNDLRKALAEVLDSHGALGGASHELIDHGFTAERAREICGLVDDYYRRVRQH